MIRFLTISLLLISNIVYGQIFKRPASNVEFYLFKNSVPDTVSLDKIMERPPLSMKDLADTPYIKDSEIIGFFIDTDTILSEGKILIRSKHRFKLSPNRTSLINRKEIPFRYGKFALVAGGKVIYTGYFWNYYSSLGNDSITAFESHIEIVVYRKFPDYGVAADTYDARNSQALFDCLSSTNRFSPK